MLMLLSTFRTAVIVHSAQPKTSKSIEIESSEDEYENVDHDKDS